MGSRSFYSKLVVVVGRPYLGAEEKKEKEEKFIATIDILVAIIPVSIETLLLL